MTAEQRALLEAQLAEAKEAYHQAMMGKSVFSLTDQNGEKITYNNLSAARLKAYISELESKLKTGSSSGPMRVYF